MVKRFLPVNLFCIAVFLFIANSASALDYRDSILNSIIYSGQGLTQSDEDYTQSAGVASDGSGVQAQESAYKSTQLPLLIGLPIEKVKPYVRMQGPDFNSPLVEEKGRAEEFIVNDAQFSHTPAKKVSTTELLYYPSSEDYLKEVTSVGYYVHNGQLTTSNFIYHDAAIFKPQRTPYYQEIQQKFQKSKALIFEEKTSTVNQKDLDFYHFKREDGYIESYGFYEIPPKYGMEAKIALVFQALYPNTQKESLAKHATKLFKEHYHAVNQRYKKLSQ